LPDYPPIIFFYQAAVEYGAPFFDQLWPEARAVSDPNRLFYQAFNIQQGSIGQLFGPEVMVCGLRATAKGHLVGKPQGDVWVMPGLFLIKGNKIIWQHDFRHAGDHPDFSKIAEIKAK
jgi:hypothetical protein